MEKLKDRELIELILDQKQYFADCSQEKRELWNNIYSAYNSKIDTDNPFLSNLFVPKIHEAVELLAAFLAGKNQSITTSPEGVNDTKKADVAQKLLDFQWRKVLYAHDKIVKWVKQAITFGNGIIKVGWNMNGDKDEPFMQVVGLDSIFFDYYTEDIQESPVIHRVIKDKQLVINDDRYDKRYRKDVISIEDSDIEEDETTFSASDGTTHQSTNSFKRVELLEYWGADNEELVTIANTSTGYQILRRVENPYKTVDGIKFKPFVKNKFKTSPLPNRAYDIGAIEPSLKLNLALNDAVREFLDNTMLINNKQWIVRRGAKIAPSDLVRRPGGIVKVDDINADIKSEEVGDIKQSMIEMIRYLDDEFQQASMVVNLLKGIGGSDTATEAALGQQNVQTQLDLVDRNIKEGFNRLGQMLMNLNIQNISKAMTIKIFDDDDKAIFMEVDPKSINGRFDVVINADRPPSESKAVRQKQLLDFLAIVGQDANTMQKYPDLTIKIYKEWLREGGFNDIDYFFQKDEEAEEANEFGLIKSPDRNKGLTSGAIDQSAMSPAINPRTNI